jgi:hypothetical protein
MAVTRAVRCKQNTAPLPSDFPEDPLMRKTLLLAGLAFVCLCAPALAGQAACVHARVQIGDGKSTGVTQNCDYNMNGTMQAGNGMSSTSRQNGGYNQSQSVQLGNGNFTGARQHGRDNSFGSYQGGNGNHTVVHQW